jgi:hypothetical protein
LLLCGCNNALDFRNAEISNNKIYEKGKNTGFSGKVTNIPLSKIPFGQIVPVSNMIGKVTGNKALNDLIYLNSLAVIQDGGVICDTVAREGILNGETSCKASISGNCVVPCDHIPRRSWPLFRAKAMLDELIADLAPRSPNQHKSALEPSRT